MSQAHDFDLGVVSNHVADYLFVVAVEGDRYRCVEVNEAILRLTGYQREDFVGRFVDQIEPVNASLRLASHYGEALQRWAPVRFEDSLDTPAGQFVVEITVTPFQGADGRRYVLGVGRNVSARRRAERALREGNERLTEILESISDGFYVLDEQWRFTYVNESAERMLGKGREELVGRFAPGVYPVDAHSDVHEFFRRAVETGRPVTFETYWPPQDTWYAIRAFPGPHGLSVYFRDLGEQRRLEAQLRQVAKMEAVGQLAGGVAHDFNNLLSSILGHAQLALAGVDREQPAHRYLEEVLAASERAADLVRRLMTFSREHVRDVRLADLGAVIERVRGLVAPLMGEAVDVRVELAEGLPPVEADIAQLEQALINLAVNARDALPAGGVLSLSLRAVEHGGPDGPIEDLPAPPSGRWLRLTVEDSGIGMDEATLLRVFEPFFTTKEPGEGTGLGLFTVYAVVRQAGGSVAVDSEPGKGTRFDVWLPGAVGHVERDEPASAPALPRGAGQRVLLVEDEPAVRRLMSTVLQEQGYQVLEAQNGEEALAHLARSAETIDVLVTDVVMPGVDGPTLASRLRQGSAGLRVLLVSGHPRDQLPAGIEDWPDTAFLRKPFGVRDLAHAVHELLGD